jgi:hypothetical protein
MTVVPRSELTVYRPVSENQLLAAIARAELHQHGRLVAWAGVIQHFAFKRSGHTTRMLRPQLQALLAANAVEQCKWLGRDHFTLTSAGRRRLTRARRRGEDLSLPESPQHREWRRKHAQAIESVEGDRERVREALAQAVELLGDQGADSQAWAAMADRLHVSATELSAATYCAREWKEPDDALRDDVPPIVFGVRRRVLGREVSE